jgi:hypothetical protein
LGGSVELADNKVKIASVFFGERAFERYIYSQFKGTFKLPISPPLNIYTVDYRIISRGLKAGFP